MQKTDFLVIDTEGKDELSEVAILDHQGKLIYQAFNSGHASYVKLDRADLKTIVENLAAYVKFKEIVFHYAEHDLKVLKQSFRKVRVPWPQCKAVCSCEMAKSLFPDLPSYSLEYLSKHFGLQVEGRYFDEVSAHVAKYDAAFTHALYLNHYQLEAGRFLKLGWKPSSIS